MPNERLRDSLLRKGLNLEHVAKATSVDPKTVERWITQGRTPYPRHRRTIASMVHEAENYLWPDAVTPDRKAEIAESEVVRVYPHRSGVPRELWDRLINDAQREIEILVYVGMFLLDDRNLIKTLREKAAEGTRIRLLFGDANSREVTKRSTEENIGKNTIAAKIRQALGFFQPLDGIDGIDIRCHGTTLYNSIYRFDDEMIVNPHIYGFQAPHAPALHLRRLSAGDLFESYSESFEAVWKNGKAPKW